ncbi:MAG: polyphenol oxidase family protein [Chloroflexota bacterium]|nr:polyphenol oxidase family protein [Chloroflexota bacterium]
MSALGVERAAWRRDGELLYSPTLTSLGVVAGSTTRALGSMGGSRTPVEDAVRARDALARSLGFPGVVRVKQVHGSEVVRADAPFAPPWPEADAVWTARAGVLLGIVAADCVPVLLAEVGGTRVGAAHAGWEGTTRHVARRLVEVLRPEGVDPARMVAALGPSIGPCCYAVGDERAATIRERLGAAGERALVVRDGTTSFDLWRANAEQLRDEGVARIEVSRVCTKCGGENTWSRRSGDIGLLNLAFIGIKAEGKPPAGRPR